MFSDPHIITNEICISSTDSTPKGFVSAMHLTSLFAPYARNDVV